MVERFERGARFSSEITGEGEDNETQEAELRAADAFLENERGRASERFQTARDRDLRESMVSMSKEERVAFDAKWHAWMEDRGEMPEIRQTAEWSTEAEIAHREAVDAEVMRRILTEAKTAVDRGENQDWRAYLGEMADRFEKIADERAARSGADDQSVKDFRNSAEFYRRYLGRLTPENLRPYMK